ncbi:glycosyltransferase family 2 protein [Caulobacter sp. S45]|uniref:glycosyltransferase family 2 protein n=1 Tax=Caulobacter sp. S45 TaxID=1641861 RepID=UPI001576E483|nr:glycosyltransferase [Caulobacter sp. S45]
MANLSQGLSLATPAQAEADLAARLTAQSPRRTPPPTPWASTAIHGAVLVLWIALLGAPFGLHGVWVWSAGLVYVAYDTLLLVFTFWQTLPLLKTTPPSAAVSRRVSVAVIVAAKDEALVLPVTLKALLGQSDPPDRILIADDGSADATPEVLARLYGLEPPPLGEMSTRHPQIHWLRLGGGGKARAMNTALSLIAEEVVLTVDADTLLQPGAIAAVRDAFSAEADLVATTGVLTPVCAATTSGRIMEWFQTYEYIRNFLARYAWMRLDSLLLISGAFAGFRRAAALEVGGFDPDCLVEDYELIHRLKRYSVRHGRRWTTRVLGGALARTEAPSTTLAFLRQRRRWFGGFLQTQYWYRDMVGDRRYGALGLAMLPVKAVDTLQPLYGLTAFVLLCSYVVRGRLTILEPVGGVIAAKILIDFSFQLWAIHLYRCWVGDRRIASFGHALVASIIEPFSFQLLRHLGAAWGWVVFLRGRQTWGSQQRAGALR